MKDNLKKALEMCLTAVFYLAIFLFLASSLKYCYESEDQKNQQTNIRKKIKNEDYYNLAFCKTVGGKTETRHSYKYPNGSSYIKIDCETDDTVYEGGLDKGSSLDSIQQALFASYLTGKQPTVVIYDTDGKVGPYEHRIKTAAQMASINYIYFDSGKL